MEDPGRQREIPHLEVPQTPGSAKVWHFACANKLSDKWEHWGSVCWDTPVAHVWQNLMTQVQHRVRAAALLLDLVPELVPSSSAAQWVLQWCLRNSVAGKGPWGGVRRRTGWGGPCCPLLSSWGGEKGAADLWEITAQAACSHPSLTAGYLKVVSLTLIINDF